MSVFLTRLHHDTARDQGRHYAPVADHAKARQTEGLTKGFFPCWAIIIARPTGHASPSEVGEDLREGWPVLRDMSLRTRYLTKIGPFQGSLLSGWEICEDSNQTGRPRERPERPISHSIMGRF